MYIDLTLKLDAHHSALKLYKETEHSFIRLGHYATHLDTHLKSTVPLEYIHRRGVLIDVTTVKNSDIEMHDIDLSFVEENDFVIFKTDMIKKYDYGSKDYFTQHTQLSNGIIDSLIDKKVSFIGIDAAGIRRGTEHVLADKQCEENKIYVIENLNHLDVLIKYHVKSFKVITSWIEVPGQTGLPCRVIALLE